MVTDHLGTPQQIFDNTGTTVWEAAYLPFGSAQIRMGAITCNLRFPGQYFDAETGLHYNWHRYYDPGTGRYLTPDPIGLAGGINPFVYASNTPLNRIDPWGLKSFGDFKYYGNWGGPGWTGGKWTSWEKMSPVEKQAALDPNYRYAPVDKQDRCYMKHDICYGNCRDNCKNATCPEQCEKDCFNGCDNSLSGCLMDCGMMPGAIDEIQRSIAIPTFHLQPAFRNRGYDIEGSYYQLKFSF